MCYAGGFAVGREKGRPGADAAGDTLLGHRPARGVEQVSRIPDFAGDHHIETGLQPTEPIRLDHSPLSANSP